MSANPSTKWFWNDWDNDRALALCSFAAQGLWIRMLSIAARAGGYLRVAGNQCSMDDLSVLVGHPVSEIVPLVSELEARGVFSRTRDGTIYSRRIVRDEKNRKFFQKKGKEGGNPQLLANGSDKTKKSQPLNPPINGHDKGEGSPPRARSLLPTPKEDSVGASAPTAADAAPPSALRVVHPEPVTPPTPPVRDYVKEAFAKCETILGPKGRGLIGEAKKLGYNSLVILDALDATEHYCVGEPVGYFRKCLRDTANNMRPASNGENLFEGANRAAEAVIKRHQGSLGDNREDAEPLLDCVGPSGHEAGAGRGLVRRLN